MKKIIYISLIFLILLFLIIANLPKILSTTYFKNYLINKTENKTNSKITINDLNFSWFGPQTIKDMDYKDENLKFDIKEISIDMSLYSFYKSISSFRNKIDILTISKKINFLSKTKITSLNIQISYPNYPFVSLYNISAIIDKKNTLTNVDISGSTDKNLSTHFNINFNLDKNNNIQNLNSKKLPTILIDQILFFNKPTLKGSLYQILGPNLNATLNTDIKNNKGKIDLSLNSTNLLTNLNLYLDKNEIKLLNPADIVLDLSNGSEFKTKNNNKIFIRSDKEKKINIKISKNNFVFPIDFDIRKIKIENLYINPNIIYTLNTNSLETITQIAKLPNSNIIKVWCTPVNIKIENGILSTDRMDFLINNLLHLCTWGKINLINKTVGMNLGITSQALRYSYDIKNLSDDYVLKISIKGTLDNIKIDPSKAVAKILALKALQSQGTIGSFIQGIITTKKDDDIPNAKKPFPWEEKGFDNQNQNQNIFDIFK
jgi:hypothetical protein